MAGIFDLKAVCLLLGILRVFYARLFLWLVIDSGRVVQSEGLSADVWPMSGLILALAKFFFHIGHAEGAGCSCKREEGRSVHICFIASTTFPPNLTLNIDVSFTSSHGHG